MSRPTVIKHQKLVLTDDDLHGILKGLHDNGRLKFLLDRLGISYDESDKANDDSGVICGHCSEEIGGDGVNCEVCQEWYHLENEKECSGINGKFKDLLNSDNILYICNKCKNSDLSFNRRFDKHNKCIEGKLQEVNSKVELIRDVLNKAEETVKQPMSSFSPCSSSPVTYAGVAKKHLLVVKSTDNTRKAADKKEEISDALGDLQITDARFGRSGNVVLNFETEHQRDEAAAKVGVLDNLSATKSKKLFPKIMICNVSTMENKDDLVQTIIRRNDYLQGIDGIMDKISLVFDKGAAGDTKHYILRCHPEVRGLIHKKGDVIKLDWGIYKVRDRYFATMCYHCLNYGHIKERCPTKDNSPCCRKCAGDHSASGCSLNVKKCINCVRVKKADVDHMANEKCCPVLHCVSVFQVKKQLRDLEAKVKDQEEELDEQAGTIQMLEQVWKF